MNRPPFVPPSPHAARPELSSEQAKAALRLLMRQHSTLMANRDLGTAPVAWGWEVLMGGEEAGVAGRGVNVQGRLCVFITFRDRPYRELATTVAGVCGSLPVLVDTAGAGAPFLDALRACGVQAEPAELSQAAVQADGICATIAYAGRLGEPLACGFPAAHAGAHAWASLPAWRGAPAPKPEEPKPQEPTGSIVL